MIDYLGGLAPELIDFGALNAMPRVCAFPVRSRVICFRRILKHLASNLWRVPFLLRLYKQFFLLGLPNVWLESEADRIFGTLVDDWLPGRIGVSAFDLADFRGILSNAALSLALHLPEHLFSALPRHLGAVIYAGEDGLGTRELLRILG